MKTLELEKKKVETCNLESKIGLLTETLNETREDYDKEIKELQTKLTVNLTRGENKGWRKYS